MLVAVTPDHSLLRTSNTLHHLSTTMSFQAGCQDSTVMTLNFYRLPRLSKKFTVSTLKQQLQKVCNSCTGLTWTKFQVSFFQVRSVSILSFVAKSSCTKKCCVEGDDQLVRLFSVRRGQSCCRLSWQHDLRWTCQQHNRFVYRGANIPQTEKSDRLQKQEAYLHQAVCESSEYQRMTAASKATCESNQLSRSSIMPHVVG